MIVGPFGLTIEDDSGRVHFMQARGTCFFCGTEITGPTGIVWNGCGASVSVWPDEPGPADSQEVDGASITFCSSHCARELARHLTLDAARLDVTTERSVRALIGDRK